MNVVFEQGVEPSPLASTATNSVSAVDGAQFHCCDRQVDA